MEANYIVEIEYELGREICCRALVGEIRDRCYTNKQGSTGVLLDYEVGGLIRQVLIPHEIIQGIANFNNSRQVPDAPTRT